MKFSTYLILLLFTTCYLQSEAQTLCSNAVTITPGTTQCGNTNGNNGELTFSSNVCHTYAAQEYWFKIVGDGTNALQVDFSNLTTTLNTGVGAYLFDNCPNSSPQCLGNAIKASDASTTISFRTIDALANGSVHYLALVTSTNATGFCLDVSYVTPLPPPPNDECINAIDIPINLDYTCTTVVSSSIGAATQSMIGCNGQPVKDVWFKYNSLIIYCIGTFNIHPL